MPRVFKTFCLLKEHNMRNATMMQVMLVHDFLGDESTHLQ